MPALIILVLMTGVYLVIKGTHGRAGNIGTDAKDLITSLISKAPGSGTVQENLSRKTEPVADTGTPPPSATGSTPTSASEKTRVVATFNALKANGFSDQQAIGILGNLSAESSLNPGAVQAGGNGRGLAQWDVRDRFQTMLQWTRANGFDPNTIEGQVAFLAHEMGTRGLRSGGGGTEADAVKHATTAADAAWKFMFNFERPANSSPENAAKRASIGQGLYNKYIVGGQS